MKIKKKKVLYVYINYMYFETYIVHVVFGVRVIG